MLSVRGEKTELIRFVQSSPLGTWTQRSRTVYNRICVSTERRFKGTLTSEYELFKLVRLDAPVLAVKIAQAIRRFRPARKTALLDGLELGFGSGETTKIILSARSDLRLTALDNEPQFLPKARRALRNALRADRLQLVTADILSFLRKLPAKRFDFVAASATLHNFPAAYRQAVLTELARVLKAGALFINCDKYAQAGAAHRRAVQKRLGRYFNVAVPRRRFGFLKSAVLHYMEDETPGRRMSEKESVAAMRALGFSRIRLVCRRDMMAILVAFRPLRRDGKS